MIGCAQLAIFAIFAVFGFPVVAFIVFRWLAHRERMEMIRPPVMRASGAEPAGYQVDGSDVAQAALRKGITIVFVGLGQTIGLSFIGYEDSIPVGVRWHPGPWLLGGIIPLCVGLAQIVSALLSGATLGRRPPGPLPPPQGFSGGFDSLSNRLEKEKKTGPTPRLPFAPTQERRYYIGRSTTPADVACSSQAPRPNLGRYASGRGSRLACGRRPESPLSERRLEN